MLEVAELKKLHPVVLCTEIYSVRILFRPLTRREFDVYTKISSLNLYPTGKLEDHIFREIVLDPSVVDIMNLLYAGVVPSVVNFAYKISGNYLSSQEDLDQFNHDLSIARNQVENSSYEQFILLICKAFPSYTPDSLEEIPYSHFMRLLALAEQVSQLEKPIFLEMQKKQPDPTDSFFQDAKRAKGVDRRGGPMNTDHRSELREAQRPDLSTEMARQIETIKRVQERRQ